MSYFLYRTVIIFQILTLAMVYGVCRPSPPELGDVDAHMKKYSEYSVTHHDNIDDTSNTHSHVHKHSKDGEEHEHDHEHTKFAETATKTFFNSTPSSFALPEIEATLNIFEKNLVSNPHPSSIFRPPITLSSLS